jgi:hypothetical protein
VCGSASLLSKQKWQNIRWLGMLEETGRQEVAPIRGNGDFLACGSPRISSKLLGVLANLVTVVCQLVG